MASNFLTEFSSNSIILERVTNLNAQHIDLVHCPICCNILWKPVACNLCENSFCYQCIEKWLFEQQEQIIEYIDNDNENDYLIKSLSLTRCPFNCSPYKERKCSPLLTSILSKLTIECRNKLYGCQEILLYEQLEKHEEEFCQYKIIQCSGCKQDMFKSIFDKEHLLNCPYIELECKKCQSIFKRKDKHNKFDCMEQQICLLKQNIITCEQKSLKIFDIQRKKTDILDEKFAIIEEIYGHDNDTDDHDDQQTNKIINSIEMLTQLFSFQLIKIWQIMIAIGLIIFILLI
ncbi:unnamed protein product [Rotaria sordida]|uniref:TRAF-type domain-containing protein n=1 Tax=Rotaria sordida TaxID=392033 RepID=A0A813WKR0_9BILA|nr:unnamed protein product [Rotaria sordida]CAF3553199.1 unnamed protein product [Rotaria sordida]